MKRSKFKPALNSVCLCGSGLKYKRCCLGGGDTNGREMINLANDLMLKKEHKKALKYVRNEITNYTILHKTNVAPFVDSDNEGVLWLLDIDIKALSELVDVLLDCYRGLNDYESFSNDVERLRANVSDVRWQRKITYFQVIASLRDDWSEKIGRREVKKLLPIEDESDVEIIELYLHFRSDDFSFKKLIDILDRLISLVELPSHKLQYEVVKAAKYFCIGDEEEAKEIIENAILCYDKNNADEDLYGLMHHANAVSLLGDMNKSAKLKKQSIQEYMDLLGKREWDEKNLFDFNFEIAKSLCHLGEFEKGIEWYDCTFDILDSYIIKVFKAQALMELNDIFAINVIKEVESNLDTLSYAEDLDFKFTYSAVGIKYKQKDMIEQSILYLSKISSIEPFFEPFFETRRSNLISEISLLLTTNELKENNSLLEKIKKIIFSVNKYLILQPNIAGFGFNINQVVSDMTSKSKKNDQLDK